MAKYSVCRIYKVTLWLKFSYNCSVNLLQILHFHPHQNNNFPLVSNSNRKQCSGVVETMNIKSAYINKQKD